MSPKREKDPAFEKAFPGILFIIFICSMCCLCADRLCKEDTEESNPTVQRCQPNRTPGVIYENGSRQPSPGAYRIHTQSSGLEGYNFAAPANQMMDFRVNMSADSNDQGIVWLSSGGGATVSTTASAPPSPRSRSPHSSVLPSESSTDQSAHVHQVRRNLTPSPCRSKKPVAVGNEDELPPSYDQCVLIPSTIPDLNANATATPEAYEERQPPYFLKESTL